MTTKINSKSVITLLGASAEGELCDWLDYAIKDKMILLGFDPLTRTYFSFEGNQHPDYWDQTWKNPSDLDCLKIVIRSEHSKSSTSGERWISVPYKMLCQPLAGNWVYRITFGPASEEAESILSHCSFQPFRRDRGYVGMTSRINPLIRFDEHYSDVRNGKGHLLHKAWRSLMETTDITVQFTLVSNPNSRQSAFDIEEHLVDDLGTLAPNGLNVIPGGMKGIKELWRLGLLAKHEKATDENRAKALTLLEDKRSPVSAHYRSGHIRRLPSTCAMTTTWVSPCWVGLKKDDL